MLLLDKVAILLTVTYPFLEMAGVNGLLSAPDTDKSWTSMMFHVHPIVDHTGHTSWG